MATQEMELISIDNIDVEEYPLANIFYARQKIEAFAFDGNVVPIDSAIYSMMVKVRITP